MNTGGLGLRACWLLASACLVASSALAQNSRGTQSPSVQEQARIGAEATNEPFPPGMVAGSPTLSAIVACPFIQYSMNDLQRAKQFLGLAFGQGPSASSQYLLKVAEQQFEESRRSAPVSNPRASAAMIAARYRREHAKEAELFQQKYEEILPKLIQEVGVDALPSQATFVPPAPGDPKSAALTSLLQRELAGTGVDRKVPAVLAQRIETDPKYGLLTAIAVAEWIAAYDAAHQPIFDLQQLGSAKETFVF